MGKTGGKLRKLGKAGKSEEQWLRVGKSGAK